MVFVSDRDGNPEIYVMDADGSDIVRLSPNDAGDAGPSWGIVPLPPPTYQLYLPNVRKGN